MKLSEMDEQNEQKEGIENEAKSLQNMSPEELLQQFLSEVNKQKRDGTFDLEGLKATIESMKNILPEQSYSNIMKILESIK